MGIPPPAAFANGNGISAVSTSAFTSMQRRRRRQENGYANNDNSVIQKNSHETDSSGKDGQRSNWKRKIFRGDRNKVFLKFLLAILVLSVWVSVFRFESSDFDTKHRDNILIRNSSTLRDSTLSNGSRKSASKSKAYDSIFCRVGSNSFHQSPETNSADQTHATNVPTKPIFLWGIPSTASKFESGRRDLLRKTYLDFFQQIQSDKNYQKKRADIYNDTATTFFDNNENPICSFHEWTCDARVRANCQMIYVFFVGGHDSIDELNKQDGPPKHSSSYPKPILLNESITDFRDMLIPPNKNANGFDLKEPGTVYLDIRENQFDGKMPTWFKFASLVAQEYNSAPTTPSTNQIEYIFKVDSDLMLLTPHFLNWFNGVHAEQQMQQGLSPTKATQRTDQRQPSPAPLVKQVYGGIEFEATNCVVNFTFDHPCPLPLSGPSYMSGELNFMSVDLATYIASDDCPRDQWIIPHEDVSLSNYVYTYTNNTAYHKREHYDQTSTNNGNSKNADHSIHIVSVNTSSILLLPNMKANWETVSLTKNPDLLRNGTLLWGHSIKRGNHTQYLYWKKDKKFASFWKLFYKTYTTTGNMAATTSYKRNAKIEGRDKNNRFALLQKQTQQKKESQ